MSIRTINVDYIFNFLNNINSERVGLFISLFIHFIILIIAIGIPNFFASKPINIPTIIPIDIVNVSDITSVVEDKNQKEINETKNIVKEKDKITNTENKITKKPDIKAKSEFNQIEKKFNNSESKQLKKLDIKEKPSIEQDLKNLVTNQPEKKLVKEKEKSKLNLKKITEINELEKVETLSSKKIKPKLKPIKEEETKEITTNLDVSVKQKPKPKKEKAYDIASIYKDLRNETRSIKKNKIEEEKKEKKEVSETTNEQLKTAKLSISELDLLVRQLAGCWKATAAGTEVLSGMVVKIKGQINQNGVVLQNTLQIIDTNIVKSSRYYKPITEASMRTFYHPDCIPLKLPKDKYNQWKNIVFTFDHSVMMGR